MICEQCHALMIERPSTRQKEDADHEEHAIAMECPKCGQVEYHPLITSFWRRLAA